MPINPDGMIILVWTDGKILALDEMNEDHIRSVQDIDVVPGQYFLHIPHGVFIALPTDTIHAVGGVCFGQKFMCPTKNHC